MIKAHFLVAWVVWIVAASISAEEFTPITAPAATPAFSNTSAMPKFPLINTRFEQIEDGNDMPSEGLPEATGYDISLMQELAESLQACSNDYLKANLDKDASFKKMFNHPKDYRGHVVQFESTVKFLYVNPERLKDSKGNPLTLMRGHLSSSHQLITFLSIEPLPPGLKIGDDVLLTGVFVQRFAYINRKTPGIELTWTPLILAKHLEPIIIKEDPPPSAPWILGYIFFCSIAVGLFLMYRSRESGKTSRNNIFRRMKIQRTGKDRIFPGP
ncbi:MAG: hypothetical protein WCT04_22485 [Planctomycetota bacterium]